MQGKGIVKFFLVVMVIVCLVQYFYLYPTSRTENKADAQATAMAASFPEEQQDSVYKQVRSDFLDSMSNEVIFRIPLIKKFTYQELKSSQLALGLDLKGGMSVVLQVDLREFLRSLAGTNKNDAVFVQALDNAAKAQTSAQSDFVTLFGQEFKKLGGETKSLSRLFGTNPTLRDEINFQTSDAEVLSILREKADATVNLTFERLKNRIDELGVVQPNVSLDAARDLIIVELPGIDNPERARSFLQATAKLEFWNVYRITDNGIIEALQRADQRLEKMLAGELDSAALANEPEFEIVQDTTYDQVHDSLGNIVRVDTVITTDTIDPNELGDIANAGGPLLSKLNINLAGGQLQFPPAVIGTARGNQKDLIFSPKEDVTGYLEREEISAFFPKDLEFRWSANPIDYLEDESSDMYELYAIRKEKGRADPPLDGDRIVNANANPDPQTGEMAVNLKMDGQGAKIWREMTTKAAQDNNREIAIVLDDKVVSAPRVNEPIPSGDSRITGGFSVQEANDLANILEIGKLPAETKIIQESLVGPSLGKDNINRSVKALLIGLGLVLMFMIFYYGGGGIVSIIALFMNIFFIFGALSAWGTVLTLPGIAGIVLTIGMAVDANVIIFERIREEVREGKTLLMSISDGFKHSYSAIIDANVTTLLTAFILAYFGLGPIKGFAVVLIFGVLFSLFTAVLMGRMIIEWWTGKGRNITFFTASTRNAFANVNIDWLGKRRIAYVISSVILIIGMISFFTRGFELGVDFKGGYSYNIEFAQDQGVDPDQLRNQLTEAFGSSPIVKAVDAANTYNVTTSYLINDDRDIADSLVMGKLFEGVNTIYGGSLDKGNFKNPEGSGTHVTSSSKVGPTIADDIKRSAFYAAIFALLLIFLYLFIRFTKWQFSLGAVAALFHDTLIVLAVFSLGHGILPFTLEIDQAFIAAILTVIGYSINDTVVVFDRVREFLNTYTQKPKEEVINMAVNSTISRTVITSLTTLFVVLILFIFGGASIKGFAFALVIGIIVGTYSSVFVATPIMSDLSGELKPKETKKKKGFSRAVKTAK